MCQVYPNPRNHVYICVHTYRGTVLLAGWRLRGIVGTAIRSSAIPPGGFCRSLAGDLHIWRPDHYFVRTILSRSSVSEEARPVQSARVDPDRRW